MIRDKRGGSSGFTYDLTVRLELSCQRTEHHRPGTYIIEVTNKNMEEDMEFETTSLGSHRFGRDRQALTSEYYAAEALACDMDIPIVYNTTRNREPIEEWLEKNKPSDIYRDEGYGWIFVRRDKDASNDNSDDDDDDDNSDEDDSSDENTIGLQEAWEEMKASERFICKERIFDLAKTYNVTCGKWMFWVSTGGKGDYLWSLVAKGIASGSTLANIAKISATERDPENRDAFEHVVCIFNDNFLDKEQVYESERTIRNLGIKCPLHYKPDVFTYLGVYRNNEWQLRPTIYTSNFDILKNQSVIKEFV